MKIYFISRLTNAFKVLFLVSLLSACGGSGDGGDKPPVVNLNTTAIAQSASPFSITADVSDSDGSIASYLWQQTAGSPIVTLNSNNNATLAFTAPSVSEDTVLAFRLSVTDDQGLSASGEITITVTPASVTNLAPLITLPLTATVNSADQFNITAIASDTDGSISSYLWTQISGPPISLVSSDAPVLSFTAPAVSENNVLSFTLRVTDNIGATAIAIIDITVLAPVVSAEGVITGKILNYDDGTAVVGATVTSGNRSATTDVNGNYSLTAIEYAERTVVNVEHANYARQSKVVSLSTSQNSIQLTLQMLPIDHVQSFSSTINTTISDPASEANVAITANSLVDANGNLPTGEVTAKLTIIDPSQVTDVMPGDFLTDDSNGSLRQIESFGAVTVTFEDAQNNELNLSTGNSSTIRIPVNSKNTTPSATIPLFYYDESTGEWIEEGTASLVGSGDTAYYEGTVNHFSTWNCDDIYERVLVNGCVVDFDNNPIAGITVTSEGSDYSGSATATTNSEGLFSVYAKNSSRALIYASNSGRKTNTIEINTGESDQDLTPCLVMGEQSISIKLTWGENPRDLDSHLVGPSNTHISFSSRGSLSAEPYIKLDVDDTSGSGPEVITIARFTEPGTYTYSVDHYAGSSTISGSPAKVELNVNGQIYLYAPPAGEAADVWNVFSLSVDSANNVSVQTLGTWAETVAFN